MKKGIIKKTVMLGLGLVLAAGLVGCSGQKEDKKASDTNSKKEKVQIKIVDAENTTHLFQWDS